MEEEKNYFKKEFEENTCIVCGAPANNEVTFEYVYPDNKKIKQRFYLCRTHFDIYNKLSEIRDYVNIDRKYKRIGKEKFQEIWVVKGDTHPKTISGVIPPTEVKQQFPLETSYWRNDKGEEVAIRYRLMRF